MFRFAIVVLALSAAPAIAASAERQASLKTDTGTLAGTLLPAESGPAALILSGSGPTDRDGNGPGVRAGALRLLADGLAAAGIGTLRVDKRGLGGSAGALVSEADLRFDTYADDARAWAAWLVSETGRPCVWLIGHSEGALVAEIAAKNNPGICGLVLVSGVGRKAGDLLREQVRSGNMPAPLLNGSLQAITELEAGRTVPPPPPVLAPLFRSSIQPYLISWFAKDPVAILASESLPVLIVQGDNDFQVSVGDAKALAAARSDTTLVLLPGVNHNLKLAPTDRGANLATYSDPSLPLAPGVVDTIAGFIKSAVAH